MKNYIEEIKSKLREQIKLADNQTTRGGFDYVMYGFVEIIENDPVFSKFVEYIIDEELKVQNAIKLAHKNKEIDDDVLDELIPLHFTNHFWHDYYSMFKTAHDVIKIDKCSIEGKEATNINRAGLFFYQAAGHKKRIEPLTELKRKFYINTIKGCYDVLVSLINTNQDYFIKKDDAENISDEDLNDEIIFDLENSILTIKGKKVRISKRSNGYTNSHYILKYLLDNITEQEVFFSEIFNSNPIFGDTYKTENAWRKIHRGCEDIQTKILKDTGINDFLEYNTGKTGKVKINSKYSISSYGESSG